MEMEQFGRAVPIIAGSALMYFLVRDGQRPAMRAGDRRCLHFGFLMKATAATIAVFALFLLVLTVQQFDDGIWKAVVATIVFGIAAIFLVYLAFFVTLEYDFQSLYYRSPLAGDLAIAWTDIEEVGYSRWMQCHYIQTPQVRRIWCSYMLRGFSEFMEFLDEKHDELNGKDG